tara:strand:+ start:1014 stop:1277 length:264 start_codon:yes stop_codon:yes gene_type:complete
MQVARWEGGTPSFFLYKSCCGIIIRRVVKGESMVKVYEPNKSEKAIDVVLTELYLLKSAIENEKKEKLEDRIKKIRSLLMKIKDNLD